MGKKIPSQQYMTYREIVEMVKQMEDYRDKAIIMLLFEGWYQDLDAMGLLQQKDIIETSGAKYLKEKKVTPVTIRILKKAIKEEEIHLFARVGNGKDELIPSNYLLRQNVRYREDSRISIGVNFNGYSMSKDAIIKRFCKIKKEYKLKCTMSSIYASGMIYWGSERVRQLTGEYRTCPIIQDGIKPRVEFLKFIERAYGTSPHMGRIYWKQYVAMAEKLQEEREGTDLSWSFNL